MALLKVLIARAKIQGSLVSSDLEPLEELIGPVDLTPLGAIVVPVVGRNYLRSGPTAYGCAVVVSEDPFIVASEDGKHKWCQQELKDFTIVSRAPTELVQVLQQKHLVS